MAADSSAWPACTHTAPCNLRPLNATSTTSPVSSASLSAVWGEIQTAFSQVILFCGLGSSCSQALFESAPDPTVGSGRKTISIPDDCTGFAAGVRAAGGVLVGK